MTIPIFFNGVFGASVSFGGTSLIIIVGVIIETEKALSSDLASTRMPDRLFGSKSKKVEKKKGLFGTH